MQSCSSVEAHPQHLSTGYPVRGVLQFYPGVTLSEITVRTQEWIAPSLHKIYEPTNRSTETVGHLAVDHTMVLPCHSGKISGIDKTDTEFAAQVEYQIKSTRGGRTPRLATNQTLRQTYEPVRPARLKGQPERVTKLCQTGQWRTLMRFQ